MDLHRASDRARRERWCLDRVCSWSTGDDQRTCFNWSVITAVMTRHGSHLGRPIAIQGAIFNAFYNGHLRSIIQTVHPDRTAATFLQRSTMDRFIVTVDRFDQTVVPKKPIKLSVLPTFKPFELEFKVSGIDLNFLNVAFYLPLSFILISTCSTFNSAPPELLKSRFHCVDR